MARRNRVTPFGEIVATPARGLLMGNRGCLHDGDGRLGRARWRTTAWIACRTAFRGRRRTLMQPGRYTELFFLDEATAFAAGHRPCAECRRADYRRFADAWRRAHGLAQDEPLAAPAIDAALHAARIDPLTRAQARTPSRLGDVPAGSMVARRTEPGAAYLVFDGALRRWSHAGYGAPLAGDPDEIVTTLTPAPVRAAVAHGYAPALHASASEPY